MSANTVYENSGKHPQMENSKRFADDSDTIMGITSKDGVVLIAESWKQPKITAQKTMNIFTVDNKIFMAATGLLSDAFFFLEKLQDATERYKELHEDNMPLHMLVKQFVSYLHTYTMPVITRMPGFAMLLASWDDKPGAKLYKIYGAGEWEGVSASAVGRYSEMVQTELNDQCFNSMSLEGLTKNAAQIMKSVLKDELNEKRIDIAVMGKVTNGKYLINDPHWRAIAEIPCLKFSDEEDSSSSDSSDDLSEEDNKAE